MEYIAMVGRYRKHGQPTRARVEEIVANSRIKVALLEPAHYYRAGATVFMTPRELRSFTEHAVHQDRQQLLEDRAAQVDAELMRHGCSTKGVSGFHLRSGQRIPNS